MRLVFKKLDRDVQKQDKQTRIKHVVLKSLDFTVKKWKTIERC